MVSAQDDLTDSSATRNVTVVIHGRQMPSTICTNLSGMSSRRRRADPKDRDAASRDNNDFGDERTHSNENKMSRAAESAAGCRLEVELRTSS